MSQSKYRRQRDEQAKLDLQTLSELSRRAEEALRGPQEVHRGPLPDPYVDGITKSQGDQAYQSDVAAATAKVLHRAFGGGNGGVQLQREVNQELQEIFGRGTKLRPYVDLATQVIVHLLIVGARSESSVTAGKAALVDAKTTLIDEMKASQRLTSAINKLNADTRNTTFEKKVYKFLYPISLEYIARVEAQALEVFQKRDDFLKFIADANVRNAVRQYLVKRPPAAWDSRRGDGVLLPAAIQMYATSLGAGTAIDENVVSGAFALYTNKDVASTYEYYKAAFESELSSTSGVRVGDIEASLKSASFALRKAVREGLPELGMEPRIEREIKSALDDISNEIARISPKSGSVRDDITFEATRLVQVLGYIDGYGTGGAAWKTGAGGADLPIGLGSVSPAFKTAILAIAQRGDAPRLISDVSAAVDIDIELLGELESLRPKNIVTIPLTPAKYVTVYQALATALMSLEEAYNEAATFLPFAAGTSAAIAPKRLKVTTEFKTMVKDELKAALTAINGALTSAFSKPLVQAGVDSALQSMLDLPAPADASTPVTSYLATPFEAAGNNISDETFNLIAEGRIMKLSDVIATGGTLERAIIDAIDRQVRRMSSIPSISVIRASKDAAVRGVQSIEVALEGLRVQATSIGMQIRSNPGDRLSGVHVGLAGAGVLVGDHAVSALLNRSMMPEAGTAKAHIADAAPSLVTAAVGAYFAYGKGDASEKQRQLGNAAIVGALGHLAVRYVAKMPSVRFSQNGALKYTLQAVANAPASLLGDLSMGPSALTPAKASSHKGSLGTYVCDLVRTNNREALCYIAVQLWSSGLVAKVEPKKVVLSAGAAPAKSAAAVLKDMQANLDLGRNLSSIATVLCAIKCGLVVKCSGDVLTVDKCDHAALDKSVASHASACGDTICKAAGIAKTACQFADKISYNQEVLAALCGQSRDVSPEAKPVDAATAKKVMDALNADPKFKTYNDKLPAATKLTEARIMTDSRIAGAMIGEAFDANALTQEEAQALDKKINEILKPSAGAGAAGAGAAGAGAASDSVGERILNAMNTASPKFKTYNEGLPAAQQLTVAKLNTDPTAWVLALQGAVSARALTGAEGDAIGKAVMEVSARPNSLGGFILEPGYENMKAYSGEDAVSYLQPAPVMTSQSGYTQLEDAIMRARELSPIEKRREGVEDIVDMVVVRLNPAVAKQGEAQGLGVSLGASREVPGAELFAREMEVLGANNLWPIRQQSQTSVPQGALQYGRIAAAQGQDVSPNGLFTRGVFHPSYGRK